jgi:hypothetical protein
MKTYLLLIFTLIVITACKNTSEEQKQKFISFQKEEFFVAFSPSLEELRSDPLIKTDIIHRTISEEKYFENTPMNDSIEYILTDTLLTISNYFLINMDYDFITKYFETDSALFFKTAEIVYPNGADIPITYPAELITKFKVDKSDKLKAIYYNNIKLKSQNNESK